MPHIPYSGRKRSYIGILPILISDSLTNTSTFISLCFQILFGPLHNIYSHVDYINIMQFKLNTDTYNQTLNSIRLIKNCGIAGR